MQALPPLRRRRQQGPQLRVPPRVRVQGRVGTLLEVGTGFHPELTGRDNVFLSGTILGMGYEEVARKFDEIVAFSEIEKFIDTPVKRYSSGMYVRLAFAVASFLEPEILIVDEVLAVGDAAFQRKSLGRLNEVSERDGRTVLFVSHNLSAIRTFCKRVLVLEKGHLVFDGPVGEGLEAYIRAVPKMVDIKNAGLKDRLNRTSGAARITQVAPTNSRGEASWQFQQGETVTMTFQFEVVEHIPDMAFLIQLRSAIDGQLITTIRNNIFPSPLRPGQSGKIVLTLPDIPLRPTELSVYAALCRLDDVVYYDVVDANVDLPLLSIDAETEDKYERQGVSSLPHCVTGNIND